MTLKTQTWSPDTCECKIEQIVDQDSIKLFYFHNVCATHESLVKNKPKLSKSDFDKKRDEVLTTYESILNDNKQNNLKQHDENPNNIKKRNIIKEMKKESKYERYALKAEAQLDGERISLTRRLDNFTDEHMARALLGINSEYSLIAQEVYDKILEEMRLKAFPDG